MITNQTDLLGLTWINHRYWFISTAGSLRKSDLSAVPKASGIIDVAFSGLKGDLPPWTGERSPRTTAGSTEIGTAGVVPRWCVPL